MSQPTRPHRDIKPENIFVGRSDDPQHTRAVIADFGLAIDGVPAGSVYAGTRNYRAPESIIDCDWSAGCVPFELNKGCSTFLQPA